MFTVDGVPDEKLEKESLEELDSWAEDFKNDMKGDKRYTNVKISGKKLLLTYKDKEGKDATAKYTRAK